MTAKAIAKELLSSARQGIMEHAKYPNGKNLSLAANRSIPFVNNGRAIELRVNELVYTLTLTMRAAE